MNSSKNISQGSRKCSSITPLSRDLRPANCHRRLQSLPGAPAQPPIQRWTGRVSRSFWFRTQEGLGAISVPAPAISNDASYRPAAYGVGILLSLKLKTLQALMSARFLFSIPDPPGDRDSSKRRRAVAAFCEVQFRNSSALLANRFASNCGAPFRPKSLL